jgi:hypothetical protein
VSRSEQIAFWALELADPQFLSAWKEFLSAWKYKGIQGAYRKFGEPQDMDFNRQRMKAIWEAQETMERGVSERDNPSTFLAQGA